MSAVATVVEYALQTARVGTAAILAFALGTTATAANRTGFYADLTASAEKVKIVAGAVDGANFGVSSSDIRLTLQAGTRDGIRLAPRGGGTGTYVATITSATLGSSITATVQASTHTIAGLEIAQTFTAAQVAQAANGWTALPAATQDAVRIAGRAGGTSSYVSTITTAALTASRTITLPDASIVVSGSASALTSGTFPVATTGGLLQDSTLTDDGTITIQALNRDFKINSSSPLLWQYESDATSTERSWLTYVTGGTYRLATASDIGGISTVVFDITRTGTTPGTLTVGGVSQVTFSSVNFGITGSGTFSTPTGSNALNGNVTIAATKTMGFGSVSGSVACYVASTSAATTGTTQYGFLSTLNGSSAATNHIIGYGANPTTVAASYTCAALVGFYGFVGTITPGAGSTITRSAAFASQTKTVAGTANHCYYIGTGSTLTGSGNWGVYFDCALPNYLGTAATLINTTTDDGVNKFQVFGSIAIRAASTQDGIRLVGRAGGTSTFNCDITAGTLTATRTHTLPDITGTFALLEGTQTFSGAKTFTGGVTITTADVTITDRNVVLNTTTGTKWATATSQKQGWWNATPVVQPSGAAQAAVATTGATNSSPYGYTTAAQADGIITLLNEVRNVLVTIGLMKGAA